MNNKGLEFERMDEWKDLTYINAVHTMQQLHESNANNNINKLRDINIINQHQSSDVFKKR